MTEAPLCPKDEIDFVIPTCPKCEISMLWCAYNKALWKEDPGDNHWECKECGEKIYDEYELKGVTVISSMYDAKLGCNREFHSVTLLPEKKPNAE